MQEVKGTKVVEPTRSGPDANGVFKAKVEVNNIPKRAASSFFPSFWSKAEVVTAIKEAYASRVMIDPANPSYNEGITSRGITVGMYIDTNGTISTAFPLYGR
jgi:hypothetical protein